MRNEVKITTIAIKFENKWVLDTYARVGRELNDKKFVERFMKDYEGNGIEIVKMLETEDLSDIFYTDTLHDMSTMYMALEDRINELDGNTTILNY